MDGEYQTYSLKIRFGVFGFSIFGIKVLSEVLRKVGPQCAHVVCFCKSPLVVVAPLVKLTISNSFSSSASAIDTPLPFGPSPPLITPPPPPPPLPPFLLDAFLTLSDIAE